MVGITTYTSLPSSRLAGSATGAAGQTQDVSADGKTSTTPPAGSTSTVSNLARQLGEAAAHAEARDASLSRKELGQKATAQLDQITGYDYYLNQERHDAEVPNTDDPELLARAKQATSFVNGSGSNPFKGMSRDQLALIAYDDSGSFTVNERRAAWSEAYSQEEAWRQKVVAQAMDEYNRTGKMTNFFKEVLAYYNELPAIEQAQYPDDYASRLQELIDLDFNYMTHRAEGKGSSPANLIDQLFASAPHAGKEEVSASSSTASQSISAAQSASAANTTASTAGPASNGYDLMVSRLFGGKEPAVANGAQGMSANNIGRSAYDFLTYEDRALLSDMYAYAQDEGADLTYVDRLAEELGDYRQHDNGRLRSNFNNGHNYDAQGHQLTVSFNDKDTATASSILNGSAIGSTRIDQGFLRHILDPGYGALSNTSDLGFLEQMVTKFSAEGATHSSLGSQYATYTPVISIKDNIVLSASEDVKLKPFEPDITNVNGVWAVTEKGAAAGITLDDVIGKSGRMATASTGQEQNRYVLDAFFKKDNVSGTAILLSRLFNSDGSVEPRVETTTTTSNTSASVYSFLTKSDREMLATVYEYASANGLDPLKVDGLAFDLGVYRRAGPGGPLDNVGKAYDLQGNPFIAEFNAEDEAVAQRVLTSKAMGDTLIDRGFLEAVFTPTRMSVHASDFSFLEDVVYAFSASGSDGATNPDAKPVVRYRAEDFPPLNLDDQTVDSGSKIMLSRLLEKDLAGTIDALGMLSGNEHITRLLDLLSDNDKDMLSKFYASAQIRNEDLSKIDDMAIMLGSYRIIGQRI